MPLSGITYLEIQALSARYGSEQLIKAADIAAETRRRERKEIRNPGGYLNALCDTFCFSCNHLFKKAWIHSLPEVFRSTSASRLATHD
jgi:hypothetical protein